MEKKEKAENEKPKAESPEEAPENLPSVMIAQLLNRSS